MKKWSNCRVFVNLVDVSSVDPIWVSKGSENRYGLRGFIGWVVAMARRLFQDEQDVGEDSITTKKKSL